MSIRQSYWGRQCGHRPPSAANSEMLGSPFSWSHPFWMSRCWSISDHPCRWRSQQDNDGGDSELVAVVFIAMTDLRLESDHNESQSKSESPRERQVPWWSRQAKPRLYRDKRNGPLETFPPATSLLRPSPFSLFFSFPLSLSLSLQSTIMHAPDFLYLQTLPGAQHSIDSEW